MLYWIRKDSSLLCISTTALIVLIQLPFKKQPVTRLQVLQIVNMVQRPAGEAIYDQFASQFLNSCILAQ